MASIAFLDGLAAGTGALADSLTSRGKSALEERLAKDREARAEQRELAREERAAKRDAARVDKDQSRMLERDGKLLMQYRNRDGDILREEAATPDQIEDWQFARKKRQMETDKGGLELAILTDKFQNVATDRDLERQKTRAEIANLQDPRRWDRGRGGSSSSSSESLGTPIETSQVARQLIKDYSDLVESYDELTQEEIYRIAQSTVREATRQGKDFGDSFRNALAIYNSNKSNKGN